MMPRREHYPWEDEGREADRTPRVAETRQAEKRREPWRPANKLPDPDPRDGYVHRWVRVSMLGEVDSNNFSQARREYWEPCVPGDYPELELELGLNMNQFTQSGKIEVGGLVLCRMPEDIAAEREDYFRRENERTIAGVDNSYLQNRDPRTGMRAIAQRQTRDTFGNTPS